jgi:hypothetical protein
MEFKKITAILTIVCLCISGIFSEAQARVPKTLDGKESRFTYSNERTWSPSQNILSITIADKWRLDDAGVTFVDDLFYYEKVNLRFPAGANEISVTCTPRESDPADVIVATYLMPDFKQYPPGLLPGCFITPFADLSGL